MHFSKEAVVLAVQRRVSAGIVRALAQSSHLTEKARLCLEPLNGLQMRAFCRRTIARSPIEDRARRWLCKAVALVTLGAATPVLAQPAPEDARVLFESLAVSPEIRLAAGWDDNVLRLSNADRPAGDFITIVAPAVQAWLRLPGVRIRGRSEVDLVYLKELSHLSSIDTDNGAQVELLLNRVTPYVGGAWVNTRHRQNLEIDAPIRRVESAWYAGIDVRLSGKTSVGLMTRGSLSDYKGDTLYLNTDLAQYLGASVRADGVKVRYAATPFTSVGADVEQYRNRFATAPERDSDAVRVTSVIELQPLARVSGRAEIGVTRRTFVDGNAPEFQGTVARVDLGYTLLERTRFAVGVQRDLSYSYRADQRDYLQTGVQLSVTHRFADAWDVRGTLSRFNLKYGVGEPSERVSRLRRRCRLSRWKQENGVPAHAADADVGVRGVAGF